LYKQITTNEKFKVFYFRNSYVNGSSAQLKAVAYKDGSQVLNGFKIAPTKKSKQKPGILILPACMELIKHQGYCR
jgi:hypothetical protein